MRRLLEMRAALLPAALVLWALGANAAAAQDSSPSLGGGLSYMTAFGPKNYSVVALLYGTIVISLAVVTIIGILVLAGALLRGRRAGAIGGPAAVPLERPSSGLAFIYVGIAITTAVLFASAIWNYVVLADVASPPRDVAATLRVTGQQWWWRVAYTGQGNARNFTTANEIHIPVGRPVRIELGAADVIHSFWVPALTGKTDTIPGQQNVTWMQADKPGIYRGQCTEYCGQQHAHMGFVVVAEPQQQFEAWWSHQLEGPKTPSDERAMQAAGGGQAVFMRHCAVCHAVRGTSAHGIVGPDLSHLMERRSIAAATLPNSIGALSGWISDPQHIKPGNLMPVLNLSGAELNSLRSFLLTLQ
jgi:cytochrome c oxidase subunit 2